ncbi:MAG: hypothetical protein ACYC5O_19110 [Anaerolineae bacterium]
MSLAEFERQVFSCALTSPVCGIPTIRRLSPSSISLRVNVSSQGFIDAFYNEHTGTTAYALVVDGRRAFGADNTGGWHVHPFSAPDQHCPLDGPLSFADFVAEVEHHLPDG